VSDPFLGRTHWATIRGAYARAPFFRQYAEAFEALYQPQGEDERLSEINHRFIVTICALLDIHTPIRWSADYAATAGRNERLVEICTKAAATDYLSGPSAAGYLDVALFDRSGIAVALADYSGYPEYAQLYPPFEHQVSILDLLFSEGPDAIRYMKAM